MTESEYHKLTDCVVTCSDPKDKWTLLCHWLPYPAFKPEKEGRYLVCIPSICRPWEPTVDILNWGKNEERDAWYITDPNSCDVNDLESGDYTVDDVYAWMPLPEPMPMPMEEKQDGV